MIVSWKWLGEYVALKEPVEQIAARLTMAGLNLESISKVGDDSAVDLEVTSNRPDCLGHIGIAREVSVLTGAPLKVAEAQPPVSKDPTSAATSVEIESLDLCPQYIARVIRGVKVGPSPAWLVERLTTIGITPINNVVDVTNYVLMECGQPLHAFDFDKLHGKRIVVRLARKGEKIEAINQRTFELEPEMCIIADADHPVAIAGVMGGRETEISDATTNVLIETANFASLSIRSTARKLSLHSDSSYRFERSVDATRLDWASRRCCELILQIAGGELLDGSVFAGTPPVDERPPIVLRFAQISRILGIDVPRDRAISILQSLGCELRGKAGDDRCEFIAPSWRRDLTREVDLIEEVARVHGYDKIPQNVAVPLQLSSRTRRDRVTGRIRELLTGAGYYEAVTLSFISKDLAELFHPHSNRPSLQVDHSSRRHENLLRQSIIPSLLVSRRENERHGTFDAQLFEIARVYLEAAPGEPEEKVEPTMIGMVSGKSFVEVKGTIESLVARLNPKSTVTVESSDLPQFVPGRGARLLVDGKLLGWIGELDRSVSDRLDLRDSVTVAELELSALDAASDLIAEFSPLPQFPAVERDLNFILDEGVLWKDLESVVRSAAGPHLQTVGFGGQYRGQQIGADRKSYVVTVSYRAADRTLTNDEVEQAQSAVIKACTEKLGAALR
ncbi:MAG: phenylalanine--tRNA ligase subunit beta [Planctomycetaceae bacterium]